MAQKSVDFSKQNILIVENHALMRRLLSEMLRGFGVHMIREARDVPEAAKYLMQDKYDIVILDFFLGDMDGGDLTRRIRHNQSCPNRKVPILLITAQPDHDKVLKVLKDGVNEVLAKPIAPKALFARVFTMLAHERPFLIGESYVGPSPRTSKVMPQNAAEHLLGNKARLTRAMPRKISLNLSPPPPSSNEKDLFSG